MRERKGERREIRLPSSPLLEACAALDRAMEPIIISHLRGEAQRLDAEILSVAEEPAGALTQCVFAPTEEDTTVKREPKTVQLVFFDTDKPNEKKWEAQTDAAN